MLKGLNGGQARLEEKKLASETAEILRNQASEKHVRDEKLQDLYTNSVFPTFFEQFEISHR